MARRGKLRNTLELAVLAMLSGRPMHPYEIAQMLRQTGKDETFKIRYGSLYTVVRQLEKRGFVVAEGTARTGRRPERTIYRLTDEGRAELTERLQELLREPAKEYPAFPAALSLMGVLHPDDVIQVLTMRLRRLELEIAASGAALEEMTGNWKLPRLFLVESEYVLHVKRAEAEWVRGLLKELTDGTLDGLAEWRRFHETGEYPESWQDRDWAKAGPMPPTASEDGGTEES